MEALKGREYALLHFGVVGLSPLTSGTSAPHLGWVLSFFSNFFIFLICFVEYYFWIQDMKSWMSIVFFCMLDIYLLNEGTSFDLLIIVYFMWSNCEVKFFLHFLYLNIWIRYICAHCMAGTPKVLRTYNYFKI